jgi:hypothetical protein
MAVGFPTSKEIDMSLRFGLRTLLLFVAAAAVAGVAFAVIPGPDGVIHGCFKGPSGNLRVIDASVETCKNNELALAWSQTGPQGPQGEAGEAGAPGISGYEIVSRSQEHDAGFVAGGGFVDCPPGKVPLGGGAGVSEVGDDDASFFSAATVEMDFPFSNAVASGWKASFRRNTEIASPEPFVATVYAVCAFVAP